MRQAITAARRTIEIGSAPEPPAPGIDKALLEIASVGICGSDLAMWDGTDPSTQFPVRQGHEFSARIAAFGPGYVGPLREGELVAVEPLLPDGTCIACRRGHPNCCARLRVVGAHVDGALADRLLMPTRNLYPAGGLTADQAAFVEPVSIGLQMVTRSGLGAGDQAVILTPHVQVRSSSSSPNQAISRRLPGDGRRRSGTMPTVRDDVVVDELSLWPRLG